MTKYFTKEQVMTAMGEQNLMLNDIWGVEQRLDELPAADVAPVIYAHWKFVAGPDEDNNVQVMCDNCGAGDVQALDVIVPYCWKCGARMDGGESDD